MRCGVFDVEITDRWHLAISQITVSFCTNLCMFFSLVVCLRKKRVDKRNKLKSKCVILQFPPPIGAHSAFPPELVAKTSQRASSREENEVNMTSECFETLRVHENILFRFIKAQHLDEQVEKTAKLTPTKSSERTTTLGTTPPQSPLFSRESDENDGTGKSIESLRGSRSGFRRQLRLDR